MTRNQDADLVGKSNLKPRESLVLRPVEKRKLSKPQQTFNRLVKQVEKLQNELKNQAMELEQTMIEYAAKVVPVEDELNKVHIQLVLMHDPYLRGKEIKGKDQEILREVIANQIDLIESRMGEIPAEIQPIYELIHGESLKETQQAAWEMSRQKFQQLTEQLGLKNIDLSRLTPDLSPEETAAETMRVMMQINAETARIDKEVEEKLGKRKKSKAALKKEEEARQAEEAGKRSISKIYRELARALHPDLEPDESLKPQKTALMQKLTEAYKSNDLHTILRLELEWIAGENDNLERLSDEKLAVYNKLLKDQVEDLEKQLYDQLMHPNYRPIVESHPIYNEVYIVDCQDMIDDYTDIMESIKYSLKAFQNGKGLKEIRDTIKTYKDHMRQSRKNPFIF
jgi:hypothetical protein